MNMREQFYRAPYNHLIKKLNKRNIPLSESEEYDIWWILSMYSLLRVSLYVKRYYPVRPPPYKKINILAFKLIKFIEWLTEKGK